MSENEKMRVDKWLLAVRMFKTRTLATDSCNAGRVKIEGKSVKPAHTIKVGDVVSMQFGQDRKVLKVLKLINNRVGAPIAVTCYEDQSPPPIVQPGKKSDSVFYIAPTAQRDRGTGRPTKRDRRNIDTFKTPTDNLLATDWDDDTDLPQRNPTPNDFSLFFDDDDEDE